MHLKTQFARVTRVEYVLAESDIKTLALAHARTYLWRPVPTGCSERIKVEIDHDEDKFGTRVRVVRVFETADKEPESVDAVARPDGVSTE